MVDLDVRRDDELEREVSAEREKLALFRGHRRHRTWFRRQRAALVTMIIGVAVFALLLRAIVNLYQ